MPDPNGHWSTDGLPDLPPEWGRVVVPDDASSLAQEAAQVRRELRESRRATRVRSLRAVLTGPLLILVVAVLTTLAGLVTVTWPRDERPEVRSSTPAHAPTADPVGRPLPALDLVDEAQAPVPLRSLLPAVILLVDACPCPERVTEAAGAAPPGVRVVTVVGGRTVPTPTAVSPPGVRHLADPAGGLRALIHAAPTPGTVGALLVDRTGTVVRVVPAVGSVEDYRRELVGLAG
jgi:hypothetical protein